MAQDCAYEATTEMRFAVVLYGGVSLAIYMNGIVQELLSLVRATAPAPSGDGRLHVSELRGAEAVYRELGQRLTRGRLAAHGQGPVRTRFVVDLITGTSAGGINGVFLAKALANDQELGALSKLWVHEGDIANLLNDRRAFAALGNVPREIPPHSLLSGQRMFFKLVQAMRTVSQKPPTDESPYADAIDLWVTATDLRGRVEGIDIADPDHRGAVHELNHRTTFHFLYERDPGGIPNMFSAEYDPLLAFAARCTSSFPAAFEPAQLTDVAQVLPEVTTTSDGDDLGAMPWDPNAERVKGIFQAYGDSADHYETVSFADGGYLDNNPVDLVLNTLPKRRATVPVTRRVLIVDPDPGSEPVPGTLPPNARVDLVNTLIKVVTLPRQETIGSDVARIRALGQPAAIRRKLYDRIDACLREGGPPLSGTRTLSSVAYQELRRLNWMRDTARALARVGFADRAHDEDSSQCRLLVDLLESWRREHPQRFAVRSQAVDLAFELRRINFLQARLDDPMRDTSLPADSPEFRARSYLRKVLDHQFRAVARAGRRVRYRHGNPAQGQLVALQQGLAVVQEGVPGLLEQIVAVARVHQALDDVVAAFNNYLRTEVVRARRRIVRNLQHKDWLQEYRSNWRQFGLYDEVTYALQEELPGENEDIQVHRISPRDATALVDERKRNTTKLAGAHVHHFGAFFDADWRRNDILWGRLDAAERIIVVTCPDDVDRRERDALVRRAHVAIVQDALQDGDYRRLLSRLLDGGTTLPATPPTDPKAVAAEVEHVLDGFHRRYTAPPGPDRASTLQLASRAARVAGGVGTGLSREQPSPLTAPLAWAGRVLRVVAGVIDLALSQQPWDIVRHLVDLTVVASILMIVLGGVIGGDAVVGFGWTVLAVAVGLKLLAETLGAWAERRRWWVVFLFVVAAAAVLAYLWVRSTSGSAGSLGLVALGAALGFLLTSRQGGTRLIPVALAGLIVVALGIIGLRHDRDVLVGHVCDATQSWWEGAARLLPTVDCPSQSGR